MNADGRCLFFMLDGAHAGHVDSFENGTQMPAPLR
jgi:hypothetical protein